jgi:transposase
MAKKKLSKLPKRKSRASQHDKRKAAARHRAHTTELSQFLQLLHQLRESLKEPQPTDNKSRLSSLEMLFCLILKVYLRVSARTLTSFLNEIQEWNAMDRKPSSSSILNYLKSAETTALLGRLLEKTVVSLWGQELHASIDSTRLYFSGYHKEENRKTKRITIERNYVRLHVIVDNRTHLILAAKVSKWYEDEKQFFEPLLRLATERFHIVSISGDKNYCSAANVKMAEELGCTPYLMPKKTHKQGPKKSRAWNDNIERCRKGTEEDSQRYGQRKQIETAFSMVKVRFTDELESKKNHEAQINEAFCLALCHNLRALIYDRELYGTKVAFPADEASEAAQAQKPAPDAEAAPDQAENGGGHDDAAH